LNFGFLILNYQAEKRQNAMKENLIRDKSYRFALSIIDLYKILVAQKEYVMSKQLLKSGTSIGANVEEARETRYWLHLLRDSNTLDTEHFIHLIQESESLINILTFNSKNNLHKKA
jgi:hypothetical protein